MAEPKIKLTFSELALLEWLCEPGPARRIFTVHSHIREGFSMNFYELSEQGEDGKQKISMIQDRAALEALRMRFGRETFSTLNLTRAKLLSHWHSLGHVSHDNKEGKSSYDKLIDRLDRNPFHYSDQIAAANRLGIAYWAEKGKAELAAIREKQRQDQEAVGRTIVIGARSKIYLNYDAEMKRGFPERFPFPLPTRSYRRAYATAQIVKETANRYYLTKVKPIPGSDVDYSDNPIEGREPNCYIPKEAVLLDYATPAAIRALQDIDAEFVDSQKQAMRKTFDELLPILQALDSRLAQQVAQREDMLREALARYSASPDTAGADPKDDAESPKP